MLKGSFWKIQAKKISLTLLREMARFASEKIRTRIKRHKSKFEAFVKLFPIVSTKKTDKQRNRNFRDLRTTQRIWFWKMSEDTALTTFQSKSWEKI